MKIEVRGNTLEAAELLQKKFAGKQFNALSFHEVMGPDPVRYNNRDSFIAEAKSGVLIITYKQVTDQNNVICFSLENGTIEFEDNEIAIRYSDQVGRVNWTAVFLPS